MQACPGKILRVIRPITVDLQILLDFCLVIFFFVKIVSDAQFSRAYAPVDQWVQHTPTKSEILSTSLSRGDFFSDFRSRKREDVSTKTSTNG